MSRGPSAVSISEGSLSPGPGRRALGTAVGIEQPHVAVLHRGGPLPLAITRRLSAWS
jgi:hypothetical protein